MKYLHAGYVSDALWSTIGQGTLSPELDWRDILLHLCHFVIDGNISDTEKSIPELGIIENILCRGLPTLSSLYIEKQLETLGVLKCESVGKSTVSAFCCSIDKDQEKFLPLLERALCIVAPGAALVPSWGYEFPDFGSGDETSDFESKAEEEFWNGPLMSMLGPGGMQLALRQRELSSIVDMQDFKAMRTDVSVELPGSIFGQTVKGMVFEVDGPHHAKDHVQQYDRRRDAACEKKGWAKTWRQKLWKGVVARDPINLNDEGVKQVWQHPYLRRINENIHQPLRKDSLGRSALTLALFPMAVARIQRVLLELIRRGKLSLDADTWKIVVLDRDGLPGYGKAALEDFRIWLENVFAIYQPKQKLPEVIVYEITQNKQDVDFPDDADIFLDVSVLLRYGVSLSTSGAILTTSIPKVVIRSGYYLKEPHLFSFEAPVKPNASDDTVAVHLEFFLRNIFRKKAFREKQVEIILRALKGETVIALLPTGAGKSITYQLATLLQNGMAMVVDPIRSLMKDQVDNLDALCIASAYINSMINAVERERNSNHMVEGRFKFVFVSPERFIIQKFRDHLLAMHKTGNVHCAYLVIDEAHCVSEWGHDFRTAYLRLASNAKKYCRTLHVKGLPVISLTGTASLDVLDDIVIELGYQREDAITVRPDSMKRDNLKYKVVRVDSELVDFHLRMENQWYGIGNAKLDALSGVLNDMTEKLLGIELEQFLQKNYNSGLIFCPHKGDVHGVDKVKLKLAEIFPKHAQKIGEYYGSPDESKDGFALGFDPIKVQNEFKTGKLKILACTKAFGMGVDKPDIRFTLHYNYPSSLESFYQEAGRAGRDGEDAFCWILFSGNHSKQSVDYSIVKSFYKNGFPGEKLDEAKVYELLGENRVPSTTILNDLEAMLLDNTGVEFRIGYYQKMKRLYLNHPDYPGAKVYVGLNEYGDDLTAGVNEPFPEYEQAQGLLIEWCMKNKPDGVNMMEWILAKNGGVSIEPGIEELLRKQVRSITLSFDNGYIEEIANRLQLDSADIAKAFAYKNRGEEVVTKIWGLLKKSKTTNKISEEELHVWITRVFPKIRQSSSTFKVIYRLTVLGVIEDYTVNYLTKTITAQLASLPVGGYMEKLAQYIFRYAPEDVSKYLQIAKDFDSESESELRQCVHALIKFIYERIGRKRLEAMNAMERAVKQSETNPNTLAETVVDYFDSPYISDLRPFINDYSADLVIEYCQKVGGRHTELSNLLGACNRLLEQNPGNAAFRAMRFYAYSMLGYSQDVILSEIKEALKYFQQYHGWDTRENHQLLMKLRSVIRGIFPEKARVIEAHILDYHTRVIKRLTAYND
ncbi:MAG: RecQ family ATP-dependent DNA helicase [Desulfobulbaceae bacterium]|nr:RecQ family ATP-dependent DNA helicase [Desulfobulbaceae bacterium]